MDNKQINSAEFQSIQNTLAFKQLQKQIHKLKKHYISIGYSSNQVSEILHSILLRKNNQEINWQKVANTSEYYNIVEKYNSTSTIAESTLKFKKEIGQIQSNVQKETDINDLEGKKIQEINQISDTFMFRLDRNCKIDKQSSSSSSESGDQEKYQYKISNQMLKSEQEIEETNRKSSDNNCTSNKKENICKKKRKIIEIPAQVEDLPLDLQNKKYKKLNSLPNQDAHKFSGIRRSFLYNNYNQNSNNIGLQNFYDFEEIQMLEKKFKYYTQNE